MKIMSILSILIICFMGIPVSCVEATTSDNSILEDQAIESDSGIRSQDSYFLADDGIDPESSEDFSPWLSYREVVPLKRTTLVGHDTESLNDDYIFMAAVPTTVFQHKDTLYASPLLFWEPEYTASGNADLTMNSFQGLDYFIQDWITAASPEEIELINVVPGDLSWEMGNETRTTTMNSDDIYSMSADLALHHWEYSDNVVVAVVGSYPEVDDRVEGELNGTIEGLPLAEVEFFGTKSVGIEPIYHNFTIDPGYSYINAHMEWGLEWTAGSEERGKDLDMQVYDWQLGEVSASENWNVVGTPGVRPYEDASSCIYNIGEWGVAVTYMPTESLDDENETVQDISEQDSTELFGSGEAGSGDSGSALDDTENIDPGSPDATWDSDADYEIYITEYPGTTVAIPETTFFMTREARFELTWEGGDELTMLVREPAGAEITRITGNSPLDLVIDQLGEGEHTITVARMSDGNDPVDFDLSYSWEAFKDKGEAESLASAANGAVWASMNNCPLLFVKPNDIPSSVGDAIAKLGVREVDIIDFGDRFDEDINDVRGILERQLKNVNHYTKAENFYHKISDSSGQNDIVMTTMDPWTYWYSEQGPQGEMDGGRFVGPAAYAAAHHGAPVMVMELHPETSNPQAWHNRFWLEAYESRKPPSVGCMVLTGHEYYDFLGEIGLDRTAEDGTDIKESILTVAGQFDIGTAWDRVLVGKANAGRILGTPVDTSYGVCRNVFYPLMVFANPAVSPELDPFEGERITGSKSVLPGPSHVTPVITDPGGGIQVENPNLYTWVSQRHRFNERAGRDGYWGCDYTAASGITPYRTPSNNPIDKGNSPYRNDPEAMYWPDMTISEVVPFYGEKAGYDSVYSTNWDQVSENLNRGVILWIEGAHGSNSGGGRIGFWDGSNHGDENPWRAYEDGGCTEEVEGVNEITLLPWAAGPDTVRSDKNTGADYQVGYDGLVTAILQQHNTASTNGYQFDTDIDNLHSVGISGSSCLISNSYLHIAMIRHGSAFQVIDPWLTSWYSNFAIETFMRDIALGLTVGEAYANGIHHVGIEYLTGQWWWDIFENVVYFGDPDLRVYSPQYSWEEPQSISAQGASFGGHTPGGSDDHPNEVTSNFGYLAATGAGILLAVVAVMVRPRGKDEEEDLENEGRADGNVEWDY